jgi:ABC-type antimicrobial peptide transport system permease subunit
MTAALTSLFGILALVLAAIGLNGVMAYAVGSRTREIGIRMAIGATRGKVLGGVLREAARLVGAGIFLAAPAIYFCSRLIESFLFGVQPTDPASILGSDRSTSGCRDYVRMAARSAREPH